MLHERARGFKFVLLLLAFLLTGQIAQGEYLSPLEIIKSPDNLNLYVALNTGRQVALFDINQNKINKSVSLEQPVAGLCLSKDGTRLFASESGPKGQIAVIDAQNLSVIRRFPCGHYPTVLTLNSLDDTIFVCNRYADKVSAFDIETGKEKYATTVLRQPCALALSPDGQYLLVNNFLPSGAADGDYTAATVSILKPDDFSIIKNITLPNGSQALTGLTITADNQYAYVTHLISRYQLPTTQLDRGWMNTNAMSIIDLKNAKWINSVLLDDVDLGAANPWGIALSPDNKTIVIAISGNHELCLIDRAGLHERLDKAARGERVTSVTSSADYVMNDLSFLVDIKTRIKLKGLGPRGVSIIRNTAYVSEYFSDSIGTVPLDSSHPRATSWPLSENLDQISLVRQGEIFFNDASLCFQKWQSCASCHPDNGRVDALNWDLMNDGLGNPKNTRTMLLAHQTPPAMSLGVRSDAETAVRAGIRHIQFAVRPDEDAQAIDAYLKSLQPMPSPYLVDGQLTPAAQRGKLIFEKTNCAVCHSGELYTNLKSFDVGTGRYREINKPFDTPTLIELWRTAPYLHDGRAATVADIFTKFNPDDKHGRTQQLTDSEIQDLVAWLLSL